MSYIGQRVAADRHSAESAMRVPPYAGFALPPGCWVDEANPPYDSEPESQTRNPPMLAGFPASGFREIGGVAEAA